jgi:hypothetical protein
MDIGRVGLQTRAGRPRPAKADVDIGPVPRMLDYAVDSDLLHGHS